MVFKLFYHAIRKVVSCFAKYLKILNHIQQILTVTKSYRLLNPTQ